MQNYLPCYGIVRIKQYHFIINDLISDHKALPFQYADFSNPNPQKLLEDLIKSQTLPTDKPGHMKKISKKNLLSQRVNFSDVGQNYSSNMYEVIKRMNLGNIAAMKQIPDFYVSFILRYIIQIARAFAHAHKNNLVHGVFNLSKVVVQKPPTLEKKDDKNESKQLNKKALMRKSTLFGQEAENEEDVNSIKKDLNPYNYIMINFEPWTVQKVQKSFITDPSLRGRYKKLIELENLGTEHFMQIVKVQDLWRFGNSLIELLVGKDSEDIPQEVKRQPLRREKVPLLKANTSMNLNQLYKLKLAEKLKQKFEQINRELNLKRQGNGGKEDRLRPDPSMDKIDVKPFQGGISVDNIPLNWCKKPYINHLLEIICLCIGPHQFNNNFSSSKTHEIFEQIAEIAFGQYKIHFMNKMGNLKIDPICYLDQKYFKNHEWSQTIQDRLRSSVLCNQGIMMFMTISDDTQKELRNKTLKFIYTKFQGAIQLSPENLAARVNLILIEWQVGDLADEEFVLKLRNDITKYDPFCAQLLYIMFKNKIYGSEVRQDEMLEVIKNVYRNIKRVSNLTLELLEYPEIVEAREQFSLYGLLDNVNDDNSDIESPGARLSLFQQKSLRKMVYKESSKPQRNFSIDISEENNFVPQGFFISNNDHYVGVIGKEEIWIIDSRSGKKIHIQGLPQFDQEDVRKSMRKMNPQMIVENSVSQESSVDQSAILYQNSGVNFNDQQVKLEREASTTSFNTESQQSKSQNTVIESKLSNKQQLEGGTQNQQQSNEESKGVSAMSVITTSPATSQNDMKSSKPASVRASKQKIVVNELAPSVANSCQTFQNTTQDNTKESTQNQLQSSQETININLDSINTGNFISMQGTQRQIEEEKTDKRAQNSISQPNINFATGSPQQIVDSRQGNNRSMAMNENNTNIMMNQTKSSVDQKSERTNQINHIQIVESGEAFIAQNNSGSLPLIGSLSLNFTRSETVQKKLFEQRISEKDELLNKYPSEWICDIRNNGKMLAFYDKAQQIRNYNCVDEFNKSEYLYVYQIIFGQKVQNKDQIQRLDMMRLLDGQEVLNFSFDDFNDQFSRICVQAKDLYIYLIDFQKHQIVQKVAQERQHVIMKSIFYDSILHKDKNIKKYAGIKEFIKHQEMLGNKVMLPKANLQVIAILKKQSNLIQVYSIKLKKMIRQFILQTDDLTFEESKLDKLLNMGYYNFVLENEENNKTRKRDKIEERNFKKGLFSEAFDLSGRLEDYGHYKQEKKAEKQSLLDKGQKNKQDEFMSKLQEEVENEAKEKQKIKLLQISPKASIFVSHIGNEIFIKILNLQSENNYSSAVQAQSFQDLTPFMPIYQDKDYHSLLKIDMNLEAKQETTKIFKLKLSIDKVNQPLPQATQVVKQLPKSTTNTNNSLNNTLQFSENAINMSLINPGNVDRAAHYFNQLQKWQGGLLSKNEKLQELLKFLNAVLENPQSLMNCNLRKKNRSAKISSTMQLIREYQQLDTTFIKMEAFKSMKPFFIYEQFIFNRSFDTIKSFQSCSTPSKNYLSILVNRHLQVYDFISGQLLFQINVPNAGAFCLKQGLNNKQPYQKIHIVDNDNVVGIQDNKTTVLLYSIRAEIESFSQVNVKQIDKELTFKIEKPQGQEIDIDSGFNKLSYKNCANGHHHQEGDAINKSDDDSDLVSAAKATVRPLDFEQEIESIFCSRNTGTYGYMAILGKTKFSIYYIQDDNEGTVDYQSIFNKDYRFDTKFKTMGQVLNLDFEADCLTFVTGTSLGWIQIWDLQNKCLLRRFRTCEPIREKFYVPNLVKVLKDEKTVISYSIMTKQLVITSVKSIPYQDTEISQLQYELQTPLSLTKASINKDKSPEKSQRNQISSRREKAPPAEKKEEIDSIETKNYQVFDMSAQKIEEFGIVQSLHFEREENHLFVVFQRHVQVYNIKNYQKEIKLVGEYGPFESSQIFIDDYCTYFSVLLKNSRQVAYHIFDWTYSCEKMLRPLAAITTMSTTSKDGIKSHLLQRKLESHNSQQLNENSEVDKKQRPKIKILKQFNNLFSKKED